MKKLIITCVSFSFILIMGITAIFTTQLKKVNAKNEALQEEVTRLTEVNELQLKALQGAANAAIRMEIVMGVEEPDNLITYAEKCRLGVDNINKLKGADY